MNSALSGFTAALEMNSSFVELAVKVPAACLPRAAGR